jgi:hypothetical protein
MNVHTQNKHIIAAAPDLLDALKALVNTMFDSEDDLVENARRAIRKAEGRM